MGLLAAVLLACGGSNTGSFRAKSVHAPDYPAIATEAVELDPEDVEAVSNAGGQMIGQYAVSPNGVNVSREIADYGGTHFLARSAHTRESGGTFVPGGWVTHSRTVVTFDVFRVPVRAWELLPRQLKPQAK